MIEDDIKLYHDLLKEKGKVSNEEFMSIVLNKHPRQNKQSNKLTTLSKGF